MSGHIALLRKGAYGTPWIGGWVVPRAALGLDKISVSSFTNRRIYFTLWFATTERTRVQSAHIENNLEWVFPLFCQMQIHWIFVILCNRLIQGSAGKRTIINKYLMIVEYIFKDWHTCLNLRYIRALTWRNWRPKANKNQYSWSLDWVTIPRTIQYKGRLLQIMK